MSFITKNMPQRSILNNKGPNIDPCGTPKRNVFSQITINKLRSVNYKSSSQQKVLFTISTRTKDMKQFTQKQNH